MFDDPQMRGSFLCLWMDMLRRAAWEERYEMFAGKRILLVPGQFTAGRRQLSESTGVPETTIRRTIEKMILNQQLNQQISSTNSLFTITNWDKYQEVNQQTASNRPAGEPTNGQQPATLKELKNERIKELKKNTEAEEAASWRTDFKIYQAECEKAFQAALDDKEWFKERQTYHPTLDLDLTIDKAYTDFWNTEAGWQHKRKTTKKGSAINWRNTINNSLSLPSNQVKKPYEAKAFRK